MRGFARAVVSTIRYIEFVALTSAELLRDARHRAALTQSELALRAGVTQSVISAYESGHRQPALPTLAALIEATGFDLHVCVAPRRRLSRLTGPIGRRVRKHRRELVTTAAAHGITHLQIFGSVARGDDRPDSDVDLTAQIPTSLGLIGLARVTAELEQILGARVDLVPLDGLKTDVAERIATDLVSL